ncbi:MAG: hypothetical protein ACRDO1_14260 [Nocardioidaceae bacterium]
MLLPRPHWLGWTWALRVIDLDLRLPGERVDGVTVAWSAGGRSTIVTCTGDMLEVTGDVDAAASRFHLDLDAAAVDEACDRSGLSPAVPRWVRRPRCADLWTFCAAYVCGGDPDSAPVRAVFDQDPTPDDLLSTGHDQLVAHGLKPSRADHLLGVATMFADEPSAFTSAALLALDADAAVARLARLPHIGKSRAVEIATGPLGHDDVPADLTPHRDRLVELLDLSWQEIQRVVAAMAPYRGIATDSLRDAVAD